MSDFVTVNANANATNANGGGVEYERDQRSVGAHGFLASRSARSSARQRLRGLEEPHLFRGNKLVMMVQGDVVYGRANADVGVAVMAAVGIPGAWAYPSTPPSALSKTA